MTVEYLGTNGTTILQPPGLRACSEKRGEKNVRAREKWGMV